LARQAQTKIAHEWDDGVNPLQGMNVIEQENEIKGISGKSGLVFVRHKVGSYKHLGDLGEGLEGQGKRENQDSHETGEKSDGQDKS
jgi:hypothetical protein